MHGLYTLSEIQSQIVAFQISLKHSRCDFLDFASLCETTVLCEVSDILEV